MALLKCILCMKLHWYDIIIILSRFLNSEKKTKTILNIEHVYIPAIHRKRTRACLVYIHIIYRYTWVYRHMAVNMKTWTRFPKRFPDRRLRPVRKRHVTVPQRWLMVVGKWQDDGNEYLNTLHYARIQSHSRSTHTPLFPLILNLLLEFLSIFTEIQ